GEQAETDRWHQHDAGGEQRQPANHGGLRVTQRPAQERPIGGLDAALEAAQEDVAALVVIAAQGHAGQERHDGQRDQERGDDGQDDRHREAADEIAGGAGQEEERHEGEHQGGGTADHRDRDLAGGGDRRLAPRAPLAQVTGDVLHHHDRVVDQEAERDDEPDDAELVEAEAEGVQQRQADRQRERDRHHH